MLLILPFSWIEYRSDARKLGLQQNKILDLLNFKLRVIDGLLNVGKPVNTRKRGRPSVEITHHLAVRNKANVEVCPAAEVRFDLIDHMPMHSGKKEAGRCKRPGCLNGRSHILCEKYQVHLCINKDRNCFALFHRK
ncbi:Uncharacterised protein r2_g2604 [Pycnogonum litorale]